MIRTRMILIATAGLALTGAALYAALAPRTVEVDLVKARTARFERTVEEEGRTRVRDRFTVSAPVGGRLARPSLRVGDRVHAGEPILTLLPQDPTLIDRRTSASLQARAQAARATLERAKAESARARAAETLARSEASRAAGLAARGFISEATRENAELSLRESEQARIAAGHAETSAGFELNAALAALQRSARKPPSAVAEEAWTLPAPIDGQVLRLIVESEQTVGAGTPLVEIGDLGALEVIVDVLSAEAAAIRTGQAARLTLAAGAPVLTGRVRSVEPVARTKVSALGIDEQRVAVLIDLPSDLDPTPGDGWRVDASIIVDTRDDVTIVPVGALMRERGRWQVFVERGGQARLRSITLGGLNPRDAWIAAGLSPGDSVVLHPPDGLRDGSPIRPRRPLVAP